jgi:hypothetical protein
MPFNPNADVDPDRGAAPDKTYSRYVPNTGLGCAKKVFNMLN